MVLDELSFGKRPEFELYKISKDPNQQRNVAANPEYKAVFKKLSKQLTDDLRATEDLRVIGGGEKFDTYKYIGGAPRK